ncbi:MAG: hypothetical protein K2I70_04190 [Bacilli bacterium]|nr:hypothetical protein [Bacilli bacterium]
MNLSKIIGRQDKNYIQLDNKEKTDLSFINEDVPKVVFEDSELLAKLGQWLEILASKEQKYVSDSLVAYMPISANLLLEGGIHREQIDSIAYTFGLLLKQLGVLETETCVLADYDKENFSCNCHFENENDDARLRFRWGDMMDFSPELILDYHNSKRTYEYLAAHNGRKPLLSLQSFTVVNPLNSNSIYSYLSPYDVNYKVSNGENTLSIKISRPKRIHYELGSGYVFRLKNDQELVKYLLELDFPLAIDEVYKKMCEVSIDCIDEYPNFHVVVENGVDDKNKQVTDEISLKDGKLCIFTMTKNGKKISIDSGGEILYQDNIFSLNEHKEGNMEYHLNIPSMEELARLGTIEENVAKARKEIADIRLLAKTISGKDI